MGYRHFFILICLFIMFSLYNWYAIKWDEFADHLNLNYQASMAASGISNAFGLSINDSQKQNIKNITNAYASNHVDSNNTLSVNKQHDKNLSINFISLVVDSLSSIYRMFLSLGISFAVAIIFGIIAARNSLMSKIIIPIIDILQSVPILGFFPAAITFFITLFNESPIGIELAAIFLIFTSMVWNMIFSVYESVLSIPSELLQTTYAYRANPFTRLKRLYLPSILPKLIYNGILSWASGWYFLTAAEIISLGSKTYTLKGIGSLLGTSVSSGQYVQAMIALGVLIVIIIATDFLFWRPLESYSNRFRYDYSVSNVSISDDSKNRYRNLPYQSIKNNNIISGVIFRNAATFSSIHLYTFFSKIPRPFIQLKYRNLLLSKTFIKIFHVLESLILLIINYNWFATKINTKNLSLIAILSMAIIVIMYVYQESTLIHKSFLSFLHMYITIYTDPKIKEILSQIPLALLLSYLRLTAAYAITLTWTIPVAIKISHNKRFNQIMPVFQTLASIPATAFFPFVVAIVNYVPGGFEFLSILLILTGMQWYILFNILGGLRNVPADLQETALAFRVKKHTYIKKVLLPSMYPSFITGSITGWGGGWNSLIVAEYLVFGNKIYSVLGIGSLLDRASYDIGNTILILLIVAIMSSIIVIINRLVWRRIYKKVIRKYSINI